MTNTCEVKLLSEKRIWILDVDDCMYDIDCGLHDFIKLNIVTIFNAVSNQDSKGELIKDRLASLVGSHIQDISNIKQEELGLAFPPIVQTLSEIYPDTLFNFLNRFYGDEYTKISAAKKLVMAFGVAQQKGIEIFFYTNGPSNPEHGQASHVQHVLKQRGFSNLQIEQFKPKTYDLLMSVRAGRGKPTPEGMQDFLNFSGIDPSSAMMADDGIKNLKTAHEFGMAGLWTWTSDYEPKDQDISTANELNIPRVRDTGAALLQIASLAR